MVPRQSGRAGRVSRVSWPRVPSKARRCGGTEETKGRPSRSTGANAQKEHVASPSLSALQFDRAHWPSRGGNASGRSAALAQPHDPPVTDWSAGGLPQQTGICVKLDYVLKLAVLHFVSILCDGLTERIWSGVIKIWEVELINKMLNEASSVPCQMPICLHKIIKSCLFLFLHCR